MRYLIMQSDGELYQTHATFDPSGATVDIAEGTVTVLRFHEGNFEVASVHAQDDSRSLTWAPIEEVVP